MIYSVCKNFANEKKKVTSANTGKQKRVAEPASLSLRVLENLQTALQWIVLFAQEYTVKSNCYGRQNEYSQGQIEQRLPGDDFIGALVRTDKRWIRAVRDIVRSQLAARELLQVLEYVLSRCVKFTEVNAAKNLIVIVLV